ncbi:MAG: hypothetical protein OEW35_04745 [Gammaproteobacteria bacterium]|nr:hypothetical protein [Gammaproteobacteria bacterium]MDH4254503.1 hypothetical protein [Gammaproteobacteria bacterium]MDH5309107.1 hypothetical protein [Gammaproteobacteria bacterium]
MTRHACLLTITGLVLTACGPGGPDYRLVETLEAGRQTLFVEAARGESDDAPGLVRIRRKGVDNGLIYEGRVANGGEAIGADNIRPDASRAGYLWLCLNGSGQGDVAVSINLGNGLVVEDPRPCRN